MDIRLINLDRSPDRLAAFQVVNEHVMPHVTRFSAVDGKDVERPAIVERGIIAPDLGYNDGALGNALSHIALWDFAASEGRAITICEDDAVFNRLFVSASESLLREIPQDWHLISWGWNFDSILDKDYEFIVDLPIPAVPAPVDYDLGHTPDFPLNTLVLRWDLLKKFDHSPFVNAVHVPGKDVPNPIPTVDPIVELMEPFDPGKPQAKIKIPLTRPELRNLNAYGVIVSLAWRDPDGALARTVKKCTVSLDNLVTNLVTMKERDRIPKPTDKMKRGTWRFRFAVNGRWFAREFDAGPIEGLPLRVPPIVLHLSVDDGIHVSANGFIERNQGAFMVKYDLVRDDLDDRTLRFMRRREPNEPIRWDGVIEWQRDIVADKSDKSDKSKLHMTEVTESFVTRGEETLLFTIIPPHLDKDENFPLGFLDPYVDLSLESDENPFPVDKDLPPTSKAAVAPYSLEAPVVEDDKTKHDEPGSGDLVEKSEMLEYTILYTVSIEPQKV